MHTIKDRRGLLRIAKRITKMVSKMRKTTDFIELRMSSVFQILFDSGEISY